MKPQIIEKMVCSYPFTWSQVLQAKHQERTEQTHNDSSLWPDVVVRGGVKSKQEAVSHTWCKTVCLAGISPSIISLANCRIQCIETKSPAQVFHLDGLWSVVSLDQTDHVVCTKQVKSEAMNY